MDTADRFINNKAPVMTVIFFFLLSAAVILAGVFASDHIAQTVTGIHKDCIITAAGEGKAFFEIPESSRVLKASEISEEYGVYSSAPPEYFEIFFITRKKIFFCFLFTAVIIFPAGSLFSLGVLFRIYRDMEQLSEECIKISEKGGVTTRKYGETFGCIRKVSDGVSCIGRRMENMISGLEKDTEFLRDFLTDFSHQLKTSLAVIRLNNDMLDNFGTLTEEKADELSEEIVTCIDDMEQLIFSVLRFAKLNAGSIKYEKKEGCLADICRKSLMKVRHILSAGKITVVTEFDDSVRFSFDSIWLAEAITNLIKNSADHSGCSEIKVSVGETPVSAIVSVSDNGKGIPQSEIPGIFKRFGKTTGRSGMDSVGVGMSIAEKIVRAHNGEILIYSGEGKGTRFEVIFLK